MNRTLLLFRSTNSRALVAPARYLVTLIVIAITSTTIAVTIASVASARVYRSATLGSKTSSYRTWPGFGKIAPKFVSAEGDANSVVKDIHWKDWGHAKAVGFGKSYEFARQGGYLPGLWPVQLHAQDLGRCYPGGPIVYRRLARRDTRAPSRSWYHWALWPNDNYPKRQLLC